MSDLRRVVEGITAIVIWILLFLFLQWFREVGWFGYLLYAIPVALFLWFLSRRSHTVRDAVPAVVDWISYLMDHKAGWIAGFIVFLFVGGILYFFLFAPYGVLCILGLRPCGAR